ncbi:ammonium transporter [Gordonia shandongensis]|uniref:ammonium transporter n=1 Tax=Gordonia shandongensis TaxID=376351 RepID=UPI000421E6D5|nr:ammonium transporter [Gordonia shandongensis]
MQSALPDDVFGTVDTGDTAWLLISATLVLLMTPALAFFYGGLARRKSVLNMMMMSFAALASVTVVYVLWGFSTAFGDSVTGADDIGGVFADPFALFGSGQLTETRTVGGAAETVLWGATHVPATAFLAFQLTFAVIAVALVSGAIAERVRFVTWVVFTVLFVTVVYCPMAHMVWGGGLLSDAGRSLSAWMFGVADGVAKVAPIDFAGGTVVHITAGTAGLVIALVVGPRRGFGRTAYRPHNIPLVMLGASLLWFGWFGFNAGSALTADATAGLVWINTVAATAASVIGWLAVEWIRDRHPTSVGAASGVVAGLVGITPACGALTPAGSLLLGLVAGVLSALAIGLKFRYGFDDSLDVVGVHLVSGLWGTVAVGLLSHESGLLYGHDYRQLVVQVVIAAAAVAVSGVLTAVIAVALRPLGWRIDPEAELTGIDAAEHAESAYEAV